MYKTIIISTASSLVAAFIGKIAYDLSCKPDGYLYMDKDTKNVYAVLRKDPDQYKKNSRLIFVYKG